MNVSDDVAVDTDNSGQGELPYLRQLSLGEPDGSVGALVPEPIALFQLLELDAYDASKRRANESTLERSLRQTSGEEVYVLHTLIHLYRSRLNIETAKDIFRMVATTGGLLLLVVLFCVSHLSQPLDDVKADFLG